jgi:TolB-like protein
VPSSGAASDVSSIAVRPFTVLSDERELQFLADGLGEDVIALLARMPGFFVIAKASSFAFRNPDMPTSAVARQLGVRYVLGGSVRALGGKIRLSAQLADAASGRVLWSGQFDAERSDAINLQDEITRGIIVELQPALTKAEIAVIRRQRPENIGAWGFYHQAAGVLAASGWNARSVEEARGFLQRALELDPNFALARAELALLMALAQNTALIERSKTLHEEAIAAAELAIADDGGSSEVLGYAGCAITDLGDAGRGGEILKQAVELDPSNAQAQVALGAALAVRRSGWRHRLHAAWDQTQSAQPKTGILGVGARRVFDAGQTTSRGARRGETCGASGSAAVLAAAPRNSGARRPWTDRRCQDLSDLSPAASSRADTPRGRDFAWSTGDEDFG